MRGTASRPFAAFVPIIAAIPIIAAVGLSACGSSSSGASSGGSGNGVAAKSPAQIVAAAQAALRATNGFVAQGVLTQGAQAVQLRIVDRGRSMLQVQINARGKSAEVLVLPPAGYVRANLAFWTAQAVPKAASLANRWIELPAGASQQLTSGFGEFAPGAFAQCLGEDLGTLSAGGTTTVDGQAAVVVKQAGDVPGSSPGTLAVATHGPAYPLRLTSSGPSRPGGKVDACNDGKGGDTEGSLTLSDFDHAPAITAPKHPLKAGGSPSTSV
jgi:hypothetical protein